MSCCSRNRPARGATILRPAPPPAMVPAPAGGELVQLRYRGDLPLVLRGPNSGQVYRVGPAVRELRVDPADVTVLLRTQLFSRVDD